MQACLFIVDIHQPRGLTMKQSRIKQNRLLDMLVVEHIQLSREEQANNEWLADQHRNNINCIREYLTSLYPPEEVKEIDAIINKHIDHSLCLYNQ